MGEVYRARDTRLDRTVAIKVLPPHLSQDPVRKQRFEREAKTISSLNHPHICVLHDIGHQDAVDFLVMECVEGESLAERLEKGPLPLDQVMKYGAQIADALDKAHRKGIVHRDLKPGNIMLTKSGAKLLDFGLAKPAPSEAAAVTLTASPAVRPLTADGAIVGTYQYMSPEQLQGKEADSRSDIFALGTVLYEMATGKRAFEGKTQISVIAAILEQEPPPIPRLQPTAPAAFERAVRTCLKKDPEERWQSAHDLKAELEWMALGQAAAPAAVHPGGWERLMWMTGLLLTGAALFMGGYFRRPIRQEPAIRASLPPPPNVAYSFTSANWGTLALSPDGLLLAFVAQAKDSAQQLWIRPLNSLESRPLAGTEYAFAPFWSPDSRWIAFFARGKLRRVEASGGPVETLCDAPAGRGGTWNSDGQILLSPDIGKPLFQVPATGGTVAPATQLDGSRQEGTHRWPQFLPDGKHYLFYVRTSSLSTSGVYVGTLGSHEHRQVLSSILNGLYAPPGYLLYGKGTALVAQPFDIRRMEVSGTPVVLAGDLSALSPGNYASFSVSPAGPLVYSSGGVILGRQMYWYDRQGKQLGTLGSPEFSSSLQISPDGKKLALRQALLPVANFEIWSFDLAREVRARLSFTGRTALTPVWSPDGTQLAFSHTGDESSGDHLYLLSADGTGKEQPLEQPPIQSIANHPTSWSPDGSLLLFEHQDTAGKTSIWVMPMKGERKPRPFLETQFKTESGMFSPDGHWVAYVSNDSGEDEVYVVPFPGPAGRVRVSAAGGSQPRWNRDGRRIFYLSSQNKLTEAEVTENPHEFRVGATRELFALRPLTLPGYIYDAAQDGQKFLVLQELEETSVAPLTLVLNWPAEVKK